jgi:predicted  nucleic acid-binding Zn-ribbon protein
VNEQLAILIKLQDVDSRSDVIAEKRRQIPLLVEAAAKPVEEAQATLAEVQGELDALNRDRRAKEQDLEEREERIDKLKGRSADLKTNKEYQTHLFEIELAQQEKGTVEERLLELMDRTEALQKTVREHEAQIAARRHEYEAERARLQIEQNAMEAEAERLTSESKTLADQLHSANRQSYEHLKATRKGLAVAALKNGTCQGCRLSLQPQLVANIRKNEQILTCTYCHRILYSPPPVLESQKA